MITRHIVINVAAALAILSVSTVASAQGASGSGRGGQGGQGGQRGQGGQKAKATDDKDKDKDKPGPAFSGTSTEAAAQENAAATPKAQAIPDVAPNTPAARFGAKGQIAISSDIGLTIENTSQSGIDGSTTTIRLHPAIDYFVIDNLSIGGFLGLDYISTPGGSSTAFSIGPRVGYNIAFSDRFSVWPKAGISVSSKSQSADVVNPTGGGTTSVDTSNTAVAVNLFVPVMFHPVEHFFIGFGPVLDADLSGDNKSTTFGGRLSIGGWF